MAFQLKKQVFLMVTWMLTIRITSVQYLSVAPGGFNNLLQKYSLDGIKHWFVPSLRFGFYLKSVQMLINQKGTRAGYLEHLQDKYSKGKRSVKPSASSASSHIKLNRKENPTENPL